MAAQLARVVARKQMYGIRHGEALHNVVAAKYGNNVYSEFPDTTLTTKGMHQARSARVPDVDLVLVSPLTRALQTAAIMYPRVPTIALECLKELPQHTEVCNRRSSKSTLETLFPRIDFADLTPETQSWPNSMPPAVHRRRFDFYLDTLSEERIAIVGHSTWLKYYMTGQSAPEPELLHCFPYKMANGV